MVKIHTGLMRPLCLAVYPECIGPIGILSLYLDKPMTQGIPTASHRPCATDSARVDRLGLCNSLIEICMPTSGGPWPVIKTNMHLWSGGHFKNTCKLLNLRGLKFSHVNKICIFQCIGKIFCVEFQRVTLKFHTKYLTHTLKEAILM